MDFSYYTTRLSFEEPLYSRKEEDNNESPTVLKSERVLLYFHCPSEVDFLLPPPLAVPVREPEELYQKIFTVLF